MNRKIKKMFGNRILIRLDTSLEELGNKIQIKREVASGRELVSGIVCAVPFEYKDELKPGDTVVFPSFSANEAGRLGKDMITVSFKDLEWSEENVSEEG